MARPRKDPNDPKWTVRQDAVQNVGTSSEIPTGCSKCGGKCSQKSDTPDPWQIYFAAAMTGLIARGGASMESLIKTARAYADEAVAATGEKS